MEKIQTRVIVSDDAADFEEELNRELSLIDADNVKNVYIRNTPEWNFYAVIVFLED